MLNQVVVVGRIEKFSRVKELENGEKLCTMTLIVPRSYKNQDGIYENDLVPCKIWNGIVENVLEYCEINDLVGIKGRIQTKDDKVEIVAEKVTFLSHRKPKEEV